MVIRRNQNIRETVTVGSLCCGEPFEDKNDTLYMVVDDDNTLDYHHIQVVSLCDGMMEVWDTDTEVYPVNAKIVIE